MRGRFRDHRIGSRCIFRGGGVLNVWIMGDSVDDIKSIVDEYQADSGVKVNLQSIPWSAVHDKLLTAVASGKGPDVVQMGTTFMAEMADAGALLEMTEIVDSTPDFAPERFFPGNVTTTEFEGGTYGVPWYTEARVLFYRTDLLQEVGYSVAPANWDELKDAATKLADRGGDYWGISLDFKATELGPIFGRQNGSPLINSEGMPVLNEAPFVGAIEYLDEFAKENLAPTKDLGLDTSQTFGGEGLVPMFISGPWMIKTVQDFEAQENIEGKWMTAPLPTGPVSNMSMVGGSNLCIWNSSKMVDESVEFIEYLIKPENLITYNKTTGSLPAEVDAWDDPTITSNQYMDAIREQLNNAEPMPEIPAWDAITQQYVSAFEQIIEGGAPIQSTLDELNNQATSLVESMG